MTAARRTALGVTAVALLGVATLFIGHGARAATSRLGHARPAALLPPPPPTYPVTSPCASVTARPHAASVGQAIRGTVGPGSSDQGPCRGTDFAWEWTFRGERVASCADNSRTCILRSRQPSDAWAPFCIIRDSSAGSDVNSCDYVWILPKGLYDLSGTVSSPTRADAAGVTVQARGPGGLQTATTDKLGNYTFGEKAGTYTVTVTPKPGTRASVSPRGRTVAVHRDVTGVDFRLVPKVDELTLHATPGTVTANGLSGYFTVTAHDAEADGAPVTDKPLSITPQDVTPRALVCSSRGLLYPTLLSDGTPLPGHFTQTTGSDGSATFTVWPGTLGGNWEFQASESADSSVSALLALPFATAGPSTFAPGQISQQFYAAVRSTIGGGGAINLFSQSGQVAQSEASDQAVLLAFLETVTGAFPGADFGPVHAGSRAGIVFYPHGATDPTANGQVLSVDQAEDIITAAGAGLPIPQADLSTSSLAVWASQNGAASAAATLGSLSPPPGEQYEYFGFPYPPAPGAATLQAAFYGPCVAPNPSLQTVQTHSPVVLSFSGADGYHFGMTASGKPAGTGTGLVLHGPGDETTYVVPAGSYSVGVTATGTGPATIVSLAPGSRTLDVQSYRAQVKPGESSTLQLASDGVTGKLQLGRTSVAAGHGLPVTVSGLPGRLRLDHRAHLSLTIASFGEPIAGARIVASGGAHATAVTTAAGTAALTFIPHKKGHVKLTVSAPGVATSIQVEVR